MERHSETAYVGLGSNLARPVEQVTRAFDALSRLPDTHLAARSSLYTSPPMGPPDQPQYINAVARLETNLEPIALLGELRRIEAAHLRRRDGVRWGPRTLDLDLLLYAEVSIATDELTIPHPGICARAFVVVPLLELDQTLHLPDGTKLRNLRANFAAMDVIRL